jgi:hypothetical protein
VAHEYIGDDPITWTGRERRGHGQSLTPNSDRQVADLAASGSAALSTSADQDERLDSGMTATASVWVATSDGTVAP